MDNMIHNQEDNIDFQFDRNDLVGLSLLSDDPVFRKDMILDTMYKDALLEDGEDIEINSIYDNTEEDKIELDKMSRDIPNIDNMIEDEDELSIDGVSANEEITANHDIIDGVADDDVEILDYVDSLPIITKQDENTNTLFSDNDNIFNEDNIDTSDDVFIFI